MGYNGITRGDLGFSSYFSQREKKMAEYFSCTTCKVDVHALDEWWQLLTPGSTVSNPNTIVGQCCSGCVNHPSNLHFNRRRCRGKARKSWSSIGQPIVEAQQLFLTEGEKG